MRLKGSIVGFVVGLWLSGELDSVVAGKARWVPIDDAYQSPSLHRVYIDQGFITRDGSMVVLLQLTDYQVMQGNVGFGGYGPHRFFSTVTRKEFHCTDKRVRLLAFTEFSHHMGTGYAADGYVDQSHWLSIETASLNEGLWKVACIQR